MAGMGWCLTSEIRSVETEKGEETWIGNEVGVREGIEIEAASETMIGDRGIEVEVEVKPGSVDERPPVVSDSRTTFIETDVGCDDSKVEIQSQKTPVPVLPLTLRASLPGTEEKSPPLSCDTSLCINVVS